ncbi:FGGY family carbohydrate kinase, partial [Salmonella enterica subsp. enterica serovar Montevideo]|nr:FGGY family carbohydrate kinase [Salmonella enterica subsp. enterica serovar Montevideo]
MLGALEGERLSARGRKMAAMGNDPRLAAMLVNAGEGDSAATAWLGISEIDSALPPVVGSAEICGEITAQAAAITGLTVGTPVVG